MTLKQMASAIRNNVVSGLNGMSSTIFSLEQLEDEIVLTASAVVVKLINEGILDAERLYQRIDGIKLECTDVSLNCDVPTDTCAPHFTIPNINRAVAEPILYLGSLDGDISFKIYYGREYRFHKYRLSTNKRPFAWISTQANSNGLYDVFLFNLGKYNNLKYVSIDVLLDDPYEILKTDYYDQFASSEFYAPKFVQADIINTLSQKYISFYRQLYQKQPPNTQS